MDPMREIYIVEDHLIIGSIALMSPCPKTFSNRGACPLMWQQLVFSGAVIHRKEAIYHQTSQTALPSKSSLKIRHLLRTLRVCQK